MSTQELIICRCHYLDIDEIVAVQSMGECDKLTTDASQITYLGKVKDGDTFYVIELNDDISESENQITNYNSFKFDKDYLINNFKQIAEEILKHRRSGIYQNKEEFIKSNQEEYNKLSEESDEYYALYEMNFLQEEITIYLREYTVKDNNLDFRDIKVLSCSHDEEGEPDVNYKEISY